MCQQQFQAEVMDELKQEMEMSKYDELRKTEIPKYGLSLVIFDYSEFQHTKGKRLVRNLNEDYKVIEEKLRVYKNRADE